MFNTLSSRPFFRKKFLGIRGTGALNESQNMTSNREKSPSCSSSINRLLKNEELLPAGSPMSTCKMTIKKIWLLTSVCTAASFLCVSNLGVSKHLCGAVSPHDGLRVSLPPASIATQSASPASSNVKSPSLRKPNSWSFRRPHSTQHKDLNTHASIPV